MALNTMLELVKRLNLIQRARECAPLARLTTEGRRSNIKIAALYLYRPTGEYRIMYRTGSHHAKAAACYILTVGRGGSPRCIGVPSDTLAIRKGKMTENGVAPINVRPINVSPPVVFGGCLHWEPGWLGYDANDIVVFDTVAETFRSMCCPPSATSCCTHLCEMEGLIGFSCLDDGRTVARIWVLEDYEREAWSFMYHVKFPAESVCRNIYTQHLVLSHKGDVLVHSTYTYFMFCCDSTGKFLEKFSWEPKLRPRLNTG
uniref:F-box associated beta-propeller type 3 domain-containing protein n=1 Tax=Aegilops tauschii TaxID=37682 RepID=M8BPH7_AEGTA